MANWWSGFPEADVTMRFKLIPERRFCTYDDPVGSRPFLFWTRCRPFLRGLQSKLCLGIERPWKYKWHADWLIRHTPRLGAIYSSDNEDVTQFPDVFPVVSPVESSALGIRNESKNALFDAIMNVHQLRWNNDTPAAIFPLGAPHVTRTSSDDVMEWKREKKEQMSSQVNGCFIQFFFTWDEYFVFFQTKNWTPCASRL